jgi:PAS domain S-box-containing protein
MIFAMNLPPELLNKTREELLAEISMLYKRLQTGSSSARYHSLLEASFEGIVIHEDGLILDMNPAFGRLVGYTLAELKGKSVYMIVAPEYRELAREKVETHYELPYELVVLRQDGARTLVEATGKEHYYQGKQVRVVAFREMGEAHQHLRDVLRSTATTINSSLEPQIVMQRILENVQYVVPNDGCNIMLLDGEETYIACSRGRWEQYPDAVDSLRLSTRKTPNLRYMVEKGEPHCIPDTSQYDGWMTFPFNQWIKSFASAPIKLDGEIIGFLNVESTSPGQFTQFHAERLQVFADQAAVAIKNATLYDDLRKQADALENEIKERQMAEHALARRNRVLEVLNEVSKAAFSKLEVGYIMDTLARLTAHAMDVTSVYVCDWNTEAGTTTLLAEYISPYAHPLERPSELGTAVHFEEEFSDGGKWIYAPYTYFSANDPHADQKRRRHLEKFGGKAALAVPITVANEPIGYIELWESRFFREFTNEEIDSLRTIARQVGMTVRQARLYAALIESERYNSAILNILPDNLFRISREGVYLDVKPRPGSQLDAEWIVGRTLHEMMPHSVADYGLARIQEALETQTIQFFEYQLALEDELRDYEARLVVSGPDEVLAIVRDITDRKRAEVAMEIARDQAVEASRVKSQFLANMSHELRTPLNAIINYTQLALDGIYGDLTEPQRDRLSKVVRNGHNLLALVNDVLDLSKIEAGQVELSLGLVKTGTFITQVVEMLRPLAEKKHLELYYVDSQAPNLWVDEMRTRQILTNVIGNAIKFTRQGRIVVEAEAADDFVRISVTDTGIGIPSEAQKRIFDQFWQVDSSTTREYEGTGLGLAICKRLVEMHGGRISVESRVNEGSRFHIFLPAA